jgi:hypothetical protein
MSTIKEVWVKHSVVDGAHFFTGADTFSAGLCVAHADLKTAYGEVAVQLKNLAEVNHSVHGDFVPAVPIEQFEAYLEKAPQESKKINPAIAFELDAA